MSYASVRAAKPPLLLSVQSMAGYTAKFALLFCYNASISLTEGLLFDNSLLELLCFEEHLKSYCKLIQCSAK